MGVDAICRSVELLVLLVKLPFAFMDVKADVICVFGWDVVFSSSNCFVIVLDVVVSLKPSDVGRILGGCSQLVSQVAAVWVSSGFVGGSV